MTTTHDELRKLAEGACMFGPGAINRLTAYGNAVSPSVVLALLDEIVILRKGLIFYATPYTGNVARAAIAAADAVTGGSR